MSKTIYPSVCSYSVPSSTHTILLEAGQEYSLTGTFMVFPDDKHGVLLNVNNITSLDSNGGITEGTSKYYAPLGVSVSGKKEFVMVGVPHGSGRVSVIYCSEIK